MNSIRLAALTAVGLCACCLANRGHAATIFDNGTTNTIDAPSLDIEVRDSADPAPTTVSLIDGGQVGYLLNGDGTLMLDGGNNPIVSNGAVSVAVFDTSKFFMTGGETADSVNVHDNAEATISGGSVGDDLNVSGVGRLSFSGGTADDLNVSGGGIASVLGGSIDTASIAGNGRLQLLGSGRVDDIDNAADNALVLLGGSAKVDDDAFFLGNSRLVMFGGQVDDELQFYQNSSGVFAGGFVGDDLVVADNAQVFISDLTVGDTIEAEGATTTTIAGGQFGAVEATGSDDNGSTQGNVTINIHGGVIGEVVASAFPPTGPGGGPDPASPVAATVHMTGGELEDGMNIAGPTAVATVDGGVFGDGSLILASNLGRIAINNAAAGDVDVQALFGGLIDIQDMSAQAMTLTALGGNAILAGGDADSLEVLADRGNVTISGGQFDTMSLDASVLSLITIEGRDFMVNGVPFAGGDVVPASGMISGRLSDGMPFSTTFTRLVDPITREGTIRLVAVVPEPASCSALAVLMAGAVLRRRRGKD